MLTLRDANHFRCRPRTAELGRHQETKVRLDCCSRDLVTMCVV